MLILLLIVGILALGIAFFYQRIELEDLRIENDLLKKQVK